MTNISSLSYPENIYIVNGIPKHVELPVVGYGEQSISSLIAIGIPSRMDIGFPGGDHIENEMDVCCFFFLLQFIESGSYIRTTSKC